MLAGEGANFGIAPGIVGPQAEKLADKLHRESKFSGPAHECEAVNVALTVIAIPALTPIRGRNETCGFVIADHLGGNARGFGSSADIHRSQSFDAKSLTLP